MIRRLLLGAAVSFALLGCAKFPSNGLPQDTKIHFTVTFAAPVDERYIYVVAIRRITDLTHQMNDAFGPVPVFRSGSKNGIVEGRPTHFIQYSSIVPNYPLNVFYQRPPTEADPSPIELGGYQTRGQAAISADPKAGLPGSVQERQLDFEISRTDLAKDAEEGSSIDPEAIAGLQFNVLTMNKAALSGTGDRVLDALGDTQAMVQHWVWIPLTTSKIYTNIGSDQERIGDTYNGSLPPIDITDWTVEVRTP